MTITITATITIINIFINNVIISYIIIQEIIFETFKNHFFIVFPFILEQYLKIVFYLMTKGH